MRLVLIILAGAVIGGGCSEEEPEGTVQESGLKLGSLPEKKIVPDSPEALAKAFQQTLANNNAEAMMMLSLLGHGTNAWIEFSRATLQERRRVITGKLSRLEQKLRAKRTDTEQARVFSLKLELETLEKNHAASFNGLHTKLPADRKRFKEEEYHALQRALQDAHMIQDTMKLVLIDTSRFTTNFLGVKLHGGLLELRYEQDGHPLRGTIVFNCANLKNIGWVILDPPRVNPNKDFGPQPPPKRVDPEPFPAPGKER
jgi:hypothetical protein|tara:strand:- start:750 stop:1520 length:771 start_codon:yes stop_codon:yes gene_type:complete